MQSASFDTSSPSSSSSTSPRTSRTTTTTTTTSSSRTADTRSSQRILGEGPRERLLGADLLATDEALDRDGDGAVDVLR